MKTVVLSAIVCISAVVAWFSLPTAHAQQEQAQKNGDANGRWVIQRAELSAGGVEEQSAVNTVLLDTATGETWLLWPGDNLEKPYRWLPIERPQR